MSMFGAIGRIFSNVNLDAPYLSDLVRWVTRVQQGALERWLPVAMQGIVCSDANPRQGRCKQVAVAVCELCRSPTCLDHALVGATAEVICLRCIYLLRSGQQVQSASWANTNSGKAPGGQANQNAAPPPSAQDEYKELVKKHFKTLHLRTNSTAAQTRDRYRELILKNHPDRGGSEQKTKEINLAYEWLTKNHFDAQRKAS